MNHTRPPSPPLAAARPKNSSSSIASQHAASSSSALAGPSRARGATPTRSPAQAADGRPGRAPSKDSLKQKMAAKMAEEPRPNKSDEVRLPARRQRCKGCDG